MTLTSRIRRSAVVLTAGAAIAGTAAATPVFASQAHHARHVYFVIGGAESHPTVIMHGALTAAGKDDPNHRNFDVLHFGHSSLRIVHPESQATFVPKVNPDTCYATFTEKGKFTLTHGTGRYAGVRGSGTYVARGTALLARKKSGACSMNAKPRAEIFNVHARGTLG